MKPNPLLVFFKSVGLLLQGRTRFPRQRIGETINLDDGRQYKIFREIVITPSPQQPPEPQGVFRVWFIARTSPANTIRLSRFMLLGFLGLPGFRSKLWLFDETTGEFGGIYQWDTVQAADNYARSYAMRFSKWRSVPGKFRTQVYAKEGEASLLRGHADSGA